MARAGAFAFVLLFFTLLPSRAAELDLEATKVRFLKGEYKEVIDEANAALKARMRNEDWHLLLAHSLWMTGKYTEAKDAIATAERANYYSVRTRLLGYHINRSAGDLENAQRSEEHTSELQSQSNLV